MTLQSRLLADSLSFSDTASAWATVKGLLDTNGSPVSTFPTIIGMPAGSTDLGAFNYGLIGANRTIKGALQDLETAANGRLINSRNLSDLANVTTARTNLGLGSAATWGVGTSGATIPLLNTSNTWSSRQTFGSVISATAEIDIVGTTSSAGKLIYLSGGALRWQVGKDSTAESGSNSGSDFTISRYSDAGAIVDNPIKITRSTGVVTFAQPIPPGSGGTGVTSLSGLKAALSLDNVDNTSDYNKPISTAVSSALDTKMDKAGGTFASSLAVTGSLGASSYIRATNFLTVDGGSSEGGQLVLGYKNVANLSGQSSGTWNIDVDGSNSLRIISVGTTGATNPNSVTIGESSPLTVSGNGIVGAFVGNGSNDQRIVVRNNGVSGSVSGNSYLDFNNELDYTAARVASTFATDGSTSLSFILRASGARTNTTLSPAMVLSTSALTLSVPISSASTAAFTQATLSVGATAPKFTAGTSVAISDSGVANTLAVKGVTSALSGYIRFGSSASALGSADNSSVLTYGGNTVWHSGNDGALSGLDADTIRGLAPTAFRQITSSSPIQNGGFNIYSDGYKESWGYADVPANSSVTVTYPNGMYTTWVNPIVGAVSKTTAGSTANAGVGSINGIVSFVIYNWESTSQRLFWEARGV